MEKIKIKGIDEFVYKEKLSNGLEIYLAPNKNVQNFYMTFNTKFGSIYTSFKNKNDDKFTNIPNGVAHFLEHLTFKMENGEDASDYFSKIGSYSNAYTANDVTCYEVYGHDHFKENLEYLINFVQTPFYTKELVENEKGIICEEIKMYEDKPERVLYNSINEMIFKNDHRKYKVSGEIKDVKGTTLKNINDAYNMFYNPNNMFIVITGNFNYEEALSIILESQSKREYIKVNIENEVIDECDEVNITYKEMSANITIPKVCMALKIPLSTFKSLNLQKELLSIYINMILYCNFGRSSLLKEQLVTGNIIIGGIGINSYFTDKHLIIMFSTESNYPQRYISLIKEQIEKMDIDEMDLIRKQRVAISDLILETDDIEEVHDDIQDDIIKYGKVINNRYDLYNNLKIDIAKKVCKKLKIMNISTLILNPNKK